jgi:glycosyltransferase involved in cell wall biosynthesis
MAEDINISNFIKNTVLYDSVEDKEIRLNKIQREDLNKIIQKKYGLIQYSMGGGKTLLGTIYSLYRLKYNNIHNPIIIGESIAIKGTWVEKLENYINILPEIKDVPELFREADIVLVCSIFESFGRVTAEAMLASKPLIGANSGATPELIKDGTSGFLYEPGNYRELAEKIEYFIQNKQAVQEFGKVGLKIINGKLKEKDFATIFYNEIRGLKGKKEQLSWQTINMMEEALKVIEQKDKLLDQRQHVINVLSSELSWLKASRIWKARNRVVAARSKLLRNNGNN